MKKFTCHWWPCSILVLLYCSLFFKMTNRQQKKNKRSTSYIKMRQMYQAYAHTFDFLIHAFFKLALECDFWYILSFFLVHFLVNIYASGTVCTIICLCHYVGLSP